MKKFIELTDIAKFKVLVDVNKIDIVKDQAISSRIYFNESIIDVTESYEEIKKMIMEETK